MAAASARLLPGPLRDTFSGSSAKRGPSGLPSTGSQTGDRCRRRSAPRGPSEAGRQRATSPSARPKSGCGRCSMKHGSGTLPGLVKTDVTFAAAADEWLRYIEHDRGRKPSTDRRLPGAPALAAPPHLRRAADRVDHHADDRGVDRRGRPSARHADEGARPHAWHLQASTQALRAAEEPGRRSREAARRQQRRHRGLLAGGGHGARPRRCIRTGRRDLRHRRLHRPAPGRAARAALARCRFFRARLSASGPAMRTAR